MSYQEKRIVVSIFSGLFIVGAYFLYTSSKIQAGTAAADDVRFWAIAMLMFIGLGIAATIIIQIIFHILLSIGLAIKEGIKNGKVDDKEIERSIGAEMVTDERDRLIELKSMRIGFTAAGIGFVASLLSIILHHSPVVMMNILFVSFSVGSILEGVTQIYFYRRG